MRNDRQRVELMRFFKTGKGDYGEGDEFLGIKVPQTREVVKLVSDDFPLEVPDLLACKWHEVRLCGLLILVRKYEKLSARRLEKSVDAVRQRDAIVRMYLKHADKANNWDLVDLSAPKILGRWLLQETFLGGETVGLHTDYKLQLLDRLAESDNLWHQRISIVCTWYTSHEGDPSWCLRYSEKLLRHPHDLMHKAVGEMGKNVDINLLREFLRLHHHEMSRTTLRYAIEKMPEEERRKWLAA